MAILDSILSAGWPVSNLLAISSRTPERASADGADEKFAGQPVAPLSTHLAVQAGGLPRLILALACWSALPDAAALATLSWSWVAPIIARDLAVTLCVAGFWDAAIYSSLSPWASRTAALKYNAAKPRDAQFTHDMFWSLVSTLISAAAEVALLHAWARGALPAALAPAALPAVWWRHGPTLFWVLSMPYFRIVHFFCIHRAMHANFVVPLLGWDVGAFLYKHVHSLHHKSRNPTTWSGVSMHPVESSAYYSAMLIPALLGAHPMIFLFYKFDLTIAALIGHDGHGAPSTGSHDHWSVRAPPARWRKRSGRGAAADALLVHTRLSPVPHFRLGCIITRFLATTANRTSLSTGSSAPTRAPKPTLRPSSATMARSARNAGGRSKVGCRPARTAKPPPPAAAASQLGARRARRAAAGLCILNE